MAENGRLLQIGDQELFVVERGDGHPIVLCTEGRASIATASFTTNRR